MLLYRLMSSLTDPWCQSLSQCPDSTCKQDLLAYLQRIALYCHQLNICSKVKAEVQNLGGELVVSGVSLTLFKPVETLSTVYGHRCAKDPRVKVSLFPSGKMVKPIRCIFNVFFVVVFFNLVLPKQIKNTQTCWLQLLVVISSWFFKKIFPALYSLYFMSINFINGNGYEADIIAFSILERTNATQIFPNPFTT